MTLPVSPVHETRMRSIRMFSKHRSDHFLTLPKNQQGFFFLTLSKNTQRHILNDLTNKDIISFVEFLDPDQVTNVLHLLPSEKRRKTILASLSQDLEQKVTFLLRFHPQTAASMMDLNYIEVQKKSSFKDIADMVYVHEKRTGKIPAVLVVHDGIFVGEVPTSTLILQKNSAVVGNYIKPLPTITYNQPTEEVIKLFTHFPHNKIVVLDDDYRILGIIYSDDILPLIHKNNAANLYQFAGVKQEEDVFDPFYIKVKHRYKWLIVNLGTAYLAAGVVTMFEDTISKFVLLASYMPIVAGMGGNTGTQALAVTVRAIALGEIELKNGWRAIFNEMAAGCTNGIINGLIVSAIAVLWNQSALLGVVTGAAMIVSLTVAGLAGCIIPLIMKRLGKDPATSATIFITTVTDVCGFFTFLGLASMLLK